MKAKQVRDANMSRRFEREKRERERKALKVTGEAIKAKKQEKERL